MSTDSLFTPLQLGALQLPNRIIMAPLTRMRAGAGNVPTAMNAVYYAQRASAGLIISEGTAISPYAHGYPNAPGIYTAEQIAGWRVVTDAVHARGGRIFMQIGHHGRNSHSSLRPDRSAPVAPSAVPPNIPALTREFQQVKAEIPRALETAEIPIIVGTFCQAALNAVEAGFDGVELQGANSHLIEEFLEDGTNTRTDNYGVHDSNPKDLFSFVIEKLSKCHLAYLHLIEARGSEMGLTDELHEDALNNAVLFRSVFDGPLISAAAYTPDSATMAIEQNHADAIAFGRLFIANPDLVGRIKGNHPFNPADRATFYGGGEHGYTDYKTCGDVA
jgi:N-ethylmaleimide reductase